MENFINLDKNNISQEHICCAIFDNFGRAVKSSVVCQTERSELSSLQKGIYIVKVGNETAKFVKE